MIIHKVRNVFILSCLVSLTACVQKVATNPTAPAPSNKPNMIDTEIEDLSRQLIDEQRKLANIRQAKLDASFAQNKQPSSKLSKKFSGLDINRNFQCNCDIKTAMQAIAATLNWDVNKVLEIGRKPAQGVPVQIHLKDQPLIVALEQIDIQTGHFTDIRIDPAFQTILITYRLIGQPRDPHK